MPLDVTVQALTAPVISAASASVSQINVSLVTPTTGGVGGYTYTLQSSPDSSTWSTLSSAATFPYANSGLTPSQLVYYRAKAIDLTSASSPYSTAVNARTDSSSTDYSWTGTVSGSAKSAAAGYIAPLGFNGASNLQTARIYPVSSTGTVDYYVERLLGETGSISTTITANASYNTTSGTHFTATSATVTYADGEIGWKKVSIPVLAIPTGFGVIRISHSGANAYRDNSWIWLQGTGRVTSAKYLKSLGAGIDSATDTSGTGSAASPYRSLYYALQQIGATGGVLYVMDTGGNYKEIKAGSTFNGAGMGTNKCSNTSPLFIMPDPNNSGTVVWDNGETASLSNAGGIVFADYVTSVWVIGMEITHGNLAFQNDASNYSTDCVAWKMNIHDYKTNGSNAAAVRYDITSQMIIQDCNLHEIYSTEGSHNVNEYTAVLSGFHEGAQAFNAPGATICQNTFDMLEFGAFQKSPPATGTSFDVIGNLFKRFQRGTGAPGSPIAYEVAGGSSPNAQNGVVRYNAHEGNLEAGKTGTSTVFCIAVTDTNTQSSYLDMFNNVCRRSGGMMYANTVNHVRVFNNYTEDCTNTEIKLGTPTAPSNTQLDYADFNVYVRTDSNWLTHYGGGTVTYSSIATWRACVDTYVITAPDLNSTTTSTTPSYTNTAIYDYRLTTSTGRGGAYIGNGNIVVGIRNT